MPLVGAGDVRRRTGASAGQQRSISINSEPGRPALGWAAGGRSRATLDTSARSTREDGGAPWTVPSESTPLCLSPPWPYSRRRRLLLPEVVLLLVDGTGIVYLLGPGSPGDGQVLADVGLGFVVGFPATT